MGPREKALRESAARAFPSDRGVSYLADPFSQIGLERRQLQDALEEALAGWEKAARYKGAYLLKKHGDAEQIARLRKLLEEE